MESANFNSILSFSLKPGVSAKGLRGEMVPAILAGFVIYCQLGFPYVITSISDGKHKADSFHYKGLAIDIRLPRRASSGGASVPALGADCDAVVKRFREALGPDYDVLLEVDHIHIEFDPKAA